MMAEAIGGRGRGSGMSRASSAVAALPAVMLLLGAACASQTGPSGQPTTGAPSVLTITGTAVLTGIGQTSQLAATTASGGPVGTGVTWESSTTTVATVSPSGLLTATGLGTTIITALSAQARGTFSAFVVPTVLPQVTVTACGAISSSGAFVLATDLSGTASCLTVGNVAGVQLDCAGHSAPGLTMAGVNTVTVTRCTLNNVVITNSSAVILTGNTIRAGAAAPIAVAVHGGSGNQITQNTITAGGPAPAVLINLGSTNDVLQQNTIGGAEGASAAINLVGGSGHQVTGNTIMSSYDGGPNDVGTDDGVLLENEAGDLIQGNVIKNFYDAAVEGVDALTTTTVSDNTISTIGTAAIASYWCTAWSNNTIRANKVTSAPTLLKAFYNMNAALCGTSMPPPAAFSGVQIVGNHFQNPIVGTSGVPIGAAMFIDFQSGSVGGNQVAGNDFGTNTCPFLQPSTAFSDGGGNVCGPSSERLRTFLRQRP